LFRFGLLEVNAVLFFNNLEEVKFSLSVQRVARCVGHLG